MFLIYLIFFINEIEETSPYITILFGFCILGRQRRPINPRT